MRVVLLSAAVAIAILLTSKQARADADEPSEPKNISTEADASSGCSLPSDLDCDLPEARPGNDNVLIYPAAFFASAQPATAYDMIIRLPGFNFDAGDADIRGLSGSGGNVLIDGRRPAVKGETVDAVLRRIPAAGVLRIELVRNGIGGLDMQGQTLVADVIRREDAAVRGQVELGGSRYGDGRTGATGKGNLSLTKGSSQTDFAAQAYRSIDDEKGRGPRVRTNANGSLRERAIYDEHDGFVGASASLGHQRDAFGGRLQLNLSASREHERADTDLAFLEPDPSLQEVAENETKDNAEIGAGWTGPIASALSLDLTAVKRFTRDSATERAVEGPSTEDVAERAHGGETVARAALRWKASAVLTLEGGAEGAYNYLVSRSALSVDDVPVMLPAANVRVAEHRAEAFANGIWQPNSRFSATAGLRLEASRLVQSGDSSLTKSLVFPKPELSLAWSSGPQSQWRLNFNREVSQLDFGDFVSSTSLTSSTITAGNADLEPQRAWVLSADWERRFWGDGALTLSARHQWISHTVDRVGVFGPGFAFDAPGNIGAGRKSKIAIDLSLPLGRLAIQGGLLKANAGYRWTSVIDPTTGEARRISGEEPIDGEIHFTQDRPALGLRWGADYVLGKDEYEYRFDEVRRTRVSGRLSLFAEYRFAPRWTLRAFAENVTGRPVERDRSIFAGARSTQPLRYDEVRLLHTHPLIGLLFRREFGPQ